MPSHLGTLARFSCVGIAGFLVDTAVLYAALYAGSGLYAGRLLSYLCAATFTWHANRRFSFAVAAPPSGREWLKYLAANAVGGLTNLGVYSFVVASFAVGPARPMVGVAIGSVAGLLINYTLSRFMVFRNDPG